MKTLKELKGAKEISKKEQKALAGGKLACKRVTDPCPAGWDCQGYECIPPIDPEY